MKRYDTEDSFRSAWMGARKKTAFIKHLIDEGLIIKELKAIYPADIDIFDIILKNTYDIEPITRFQRADFCKEFLAQLPDGKKDFYIDVLSKYVEFGIYAFEDRKTLETPDFEKKFGRPVELFGKIGGNEEYLNTIEKLERLMYGGK